VREAVVLHRQGRRSEAGAIYQQVLREYPDHPDALHFSGLLAHQLGDDETAVARIRRALDQRPDYADALKNLGNILLARDRFAEAEQSYLRVVELNPGDGTAWSNLGIALRYQGRLAEAVEAGDRAIRLAPEQAACWYSLGNSYKVDCQFKRAIRSYRRAVELDPKFGPAHNGLCQATLALELRSPIGRLLRRRTIRAYEHWLECMPGLPVAEFMLQAVRGDSGLQRAPDNVIRNMFNQFAPNFERRLALLEYRVPRLVGEVLQDRLGKPARNLQVLDAGCGTGLCAPILRPYATRLTGVDLSAGMLALAGKTNLYDLLQEAELTSWLQQASDRFDLVVFADTLCYFGDLAPVATAAAGVLLSEGMLLFSVELDSEESPGPGYRLHPSGRYSHRRSYVERVLAEAGCTNIRCEPQVLRLELGRDVQGLLVWTRRH